MAVRLHLLGSPRIELDGHTVEPDTRKAVALLAYLAVTQESQSRDALVALLWPEMDDARGRPALRRTLSSLKTATGDASLHISREGLGVNPAEVWCDVIEFERLLAEVAHHSRGHQPDAPCTTCPPKLEAAVALYRDHFLSGFSLRDSAEFDEWQLATGEHLRRLLSTALYGLVRAYSQSGKYARAIDHARRWLAVDPLREEVHRWLMQLLAWSGARDAALRQYREAVRILDEELGVGPLPETTVLYEAIQEGRLQPPTGAAAAPSAVPPMEAPASAQPEAPASRPIPLIGRDTAWEVLQSAYGDVTATGQLVAVIGEAGIGKTHLVGAFLKHVQTAGGRAVAVACYEGEANLAYAPFTAALRALSRPDALERLRTVPAHWLAEAARLAPEVGGLVTESLAADVGGPGAQTRFFAGVSEVLCHLLSGPARGVFFLDDAQWADEASLELLAYLARRLDDLPVLLVVAWSQQGNGETRLRRLMAEAQRAGTGRAVVLTRWRPSEVLALVAARPGLTGREVEIAERLYLESEGLPYFVAEYLATLGATSDSWLMPPSVRDLLSGRLADVDEAGQQLLQTAAVIGRSFDYSTLAAASGRSEEEVIGGLERLLGRGLIREEAGAADPRYDFNHQQLRALVYENTNLARRRLLHRRVAAALQAGARGPSAGAVASLIAHHYRLGGQDAAAADYFRRAGDHARDLYANREALEHYRNALALGHPDATALHEAEGDLRTLLGEYSAALQAYESAAAQAREADLARLEHKLGGVHERRGNWELADSHYRAALNYFQGGNAAELARLMVDRGRIAYHAGDLSAARRLAEEALAARADAETEAQAHNALGILARQEGDFDAARSHLERSLALAATAAPAVRIAALNNLARLYGSNGRLEEGLALLDEAIDLCVRQGDRHREAALRNHRADLLHRAGREEEAMDSLKAAVRIYAEIGLESGDWQPEIWKLTEW